MSNDTTERKPGPRAAFLRAMLQSQAGMGLALMAASVFALILATIEAGGRSAWCWPGRRSRLLQAPSY